MSTPSHESGGRQSKNDGQSQVPTSSDKMHAAQKLMHSRMASISTPSKLGKDITIRTATPGSATQQSLSSAANSSSGHGFAAVHHQHRKMETSPVDASAVPTSSGLDAAILAGVINEDSVGSNSVNSVSMDAATGSAGTPSRKRRRMNTGGNDSNQATLERYLQKPSTKGETRDEPSTGNEHQQAVAQLLKDHEATIAKKEAQIMASQKKVLNREADLKRYHEDLTNLQTHCTRLEAVQAQYTSKVKDVVRDLVVRQAKRDIKKMRRLAEQGAHRLGRYTLTRQGTEFNEVWQRGDGYRKIDRKLEKLATERAEIDASRKGLAKRKPSASKKKMAESKDSGATLLTSGEKGSSAPMGPPTIKPTLSWEEFTEQDEIYRLRLLAIKGEEESLRRARERLDAEKSVLVKASKRLRDQERSRFNQHPTLHDRYVLLHMLGRGGFSEVFKAFDLQELRYVACKIHQLNSQWSEAKKSSYTKHAVREYSIHQSLHHERIVRLYDVFELEPNQSFCTVLEHCEGGDLDEYLKDRTHLPEKEAKSIITQLCSALKYLNTQSRKIIHYDLKPGNILFKKPGEIKITDFGLSKIFDAEQDDSEMDLTSQGAGTYWYLPPECFEAHPTISAKVDVWSTGVIFYQLLYGKKPFGNNMSQQHILQHRIISRAVTVDFPSKPSVSQETKDFIRWMLTYDKDARPDPIQLCEHSYLKPRK